MKFNSSTDIPDLSRKVIFVTGGTAGIGKESVLAFAKHNPQCVYFSGRDSKRAAEVITEAKTAAPSANLVFLECDLTSLTSVENAARQLTSESDRLDILLCNAGVMNVPPALTKEGFEIHFGVNHLSHALFIKLLLPTLLRTADEPNSDVRIVSLTSQGFIGHPGGGIVFKDLRTTQGSGLMKAMRYGQSKLANILYAAELAKRYPQIKSVSIHPGVVQTNLVASQSGFMKALIHITNPFSIVTPADGARNQLWAATYDKHSVVNGAYYEPVGVPGRHARKSKDEKLAGELWEWTDKELEGFQI
ncbi:oxidoreductase [Mycena rosella]|uniref:Oxidoreductase n=1 Tax=Mycena rosella TaxID=1033263 RepID=A0AAD7BY90_MYCRO|nr:oxidoreductase [Mycena rosella]